MRYEFSEQPNRYKTENDTDCYTRTISSQDL